MALPSCILTFAILATRLYHLFNLFPTPIQMSVTSIQLVNTSQVVHVRTARHARYLHQPPVTQHTCVASGTNRFHTKLINIIICC